MHSRHAGVTAVYGNSVDIESTARLEHEIGKDVIGSKIVMRGVPKVEFRRSVATDVMPMLLRSLFTQFIDDLAALSEAPDAVGPRCFNDLKKYLIGQAEQFRSRKDWNSTPKNVRIVF